MRRALRCITPGRFALLEKTPTVLANTVYPVALHNMNSAPLRSRDNIFLVAGQTIEIYEWKPDEPQERYRVKTLSYTYGFTRRSGDTEEELLAFHWERERTTRSPYPLGHLHIGSGLLANPTVIRPGDFHTAHIPTERVSLEAIVHFAIVELGVTSLRDDWELELAGTEDAFKVHKTV
jgi:hypothetical protein